MKRFLSAFALAVLATSAPAFAADTTTSSTPILTLMNRPTQTQSTYVVGPNKVLLEAGYNNTSISGLGNGQNYPQLQVRVGTSVKNLEVNFNAPSHVRTATTNATTDIAAGAKYLFIDKARYAVSGQVGVTIPTGTTNTNGSTTSGGFNGIYKINRMFSVKTSQIFASQNVLGSHYGSWAPSFVLTAALPKATNVFAEYASLTHAAGAGSQASRRYLLGASHAINSRLAVDLEASTSPSNNGLPKSSGIGFGAAYQL